MKTKKREVGDFGKTTHHVRGIDGIFPRINEGISKRSLQHVTGSALETIGPQIPPDTATNSVELFCMPNSWNKMVKKKSQRVQNSWHKQSRMGILNCPLHSHGIGGKISNKKHMNPCKIMHGSRDPLILTTYTGLISLSSKTASSISMSLRSCFIHCLMSSTKFKHVRV